MSGPSTYAAPTSAEEIIKSAADAALQRVKKYGPREPARRLVHPRVVSLALRAIHLLAISQNLKETCAF